MRKLGLFVSCSFLLIISFPVMAASVKVNSVCTESQWLNGSRASAGKIQVQCVAGPDNYYWIPLSQISKDAANAGPQEKIRRAATSSSSVQLSNNVTVVPNVIGFPSSAAAARIRSYGLFSSHHYSFEYGGGSNANCAMSGSPVVLEQSPAAGTRVYRNTQVIYVTEC